jgi:hypothetical protein
MWFHILLIFTENNPLLTLILVLSSEFEHDNYQLLSITRYELRCIKRPVSDPRFLFISYLLFMLIRIQVFSDNFL